MWSQLQPSFPYISTDILSIKWQNGIIIWFVRVHHFCSADKYHDPVFTALLYRDSGGLEHVLFGSSKRCMG